MQVLPGEQRDVRVGLCGLQERRLHGPAGRVVDMDDAAVRMAALAGEVETASASLVEGHAQLASAGRSRAGRFRSTNSTVARAG
jgi:hypothetical protein